MIRRALSVLVLWALALALGCAPRSCPVPEYPSGPISCEPSPADAKHPLIACLKASCCAEAQACDNEHFAPGTPERKEAARCFCLMICRDAKHRPLADCVERCGGPPTPRYTAYEACWENKCGAALEKERGGGP